MSIIKGLLNFTKLDDFGQDLVEYALLLVFLSLCALAILPTLGNSVNKIFSQTNSGLNSSQQGGS